MDRDIPVASRLCFEQDIQRSYVIHHHKMAAYKTCIDNRPPQQFEFLRKRCEDVIKKAKVERDNRNLVQKIETIFEFGHPLSIKKDIQKHAGKYMKPMGSNIRKREAHQINKENASMLHRLNNQSSSYDHRKFIKDRAKIEKNLSLISTFRPLRPGPDLNRPTVWRKDSPSKKPHKAHSSQTIKHHGVQMLYNRCDQICGNFYYVQILTKDKHFIINIQNISDESDRYQLKLQQAKGRRLLSDVFVSCQNMVSSIVINSQQKECFIDCQKIARKGSKEETRRSEDKTRLGTDASVKQQQP